MAKLKRWRKGEPLRASDLNAIASLAEKCEKLTADPPIEIVKHQTGFHIRLADVEEIWAKITGGTNPYAWTEVDPAAGGTFTVSGTGRTGTTTVNPAYEWTANTTVAANTIVRLTLTRETGEWMFVYGACS